MPLTLTTETADTAETPDADAAEPSIASWRAGIYYPEAWRAEQAKRDDLRRARATHDDVERRRAAARQSVAPPQVLATLALDADPRVRQAAAGNPSTPEGALAGLAAAAEVDVRAALAKRRTPLPEPVVLTLAADRSVRVRRLVAERAVSAASLGRPGLDTLPPAAFQTLVDDPEMRVRRAPAASAATPVRGLDVLLTDVDAEVRRAAATSLLARDAALALRSNRTYVEDYIGTGEWQEMTDAAVRAAKDIDAEVRSLAAQMQVQPLWQLEGLACDAHPLVRKAVAAHPRLADAEPPLNARLASDSHSAVRVALARNAASGVATVEQLSRDPSVAVRVAAVRTGRLPVNALATLAGDPHPRVRELVSRRFLDALR